MASIKPNDEKLLDLEKRLMSTNRSLYNASDDDPAWDRSDNIASAFDSTPADSFVGLAAKVRADIAPEVIAGDILRLAGLEVANG